MDFYRFINSKDVRAHLESIGYQFSALQAAWLVYHCRTATLDERHAAWREIIDTMPDEYFFVNRSGAPKSLHKFLRDYMALEDRFLREFLDADGPCAYNYYEPFYYCGPEPCDLLVDHRGIYYDRDRCLRDALEEVNDQCEASYALVYRIDLRNGNRVHAEYDPEGNVLSVSPEYDLFITDGQIFFDSFLPLARSLSFPLPFRKGDILCLYDYGADCCGDPFVLTDITTGPDIGNDGVRCDDVGMVIRGWSQYYNGWLYRNGVSAGYTADLERYSEEMPRGRGRVLKALSGCYKGEIDPVTFAGEYLKALADHLQALVPSLDD